jgi:hypothetical protein
VSENLSKEPRLAIAAGKERVSAGGSLRSQLHSHRFLRRTLQNWRMRSQQFSPSPREVSQDLNGSSGAQLDHALTLVVDAVMTRVLSDPRVVASVLHEIRTIVREEIAKASFADRLMDATEAARRLGMTEAAVRKAAARGTVPCQRLGRRLRFRLSELMVKREARQEHRRDGPYGRRNGPSSG